MISINVLVELIVQVSHNPQLQLKKLVIYLSLGEVKKMRTLEVTIRPSSFMVI